MSRLYEAKLERVLVRLVCVAAEQRHGGQGMTPWRRLTMLGDNLEKVRLTPQGPEGVKLNQPSHSCQAIASYRGIAHAVMRCTAWLVWFHPLTQPDSHASLPNGAHVSHLVVCQFSWQTRRSVPEAPERRAATANTDA